MRACARRRDKIKRGFYFIVAFLVVFCLHNSFRKPKSLLPVTVSFHQCRNPPNNVTDQHQLHVLVTGAAGFIGMHTSLRLRQLGHQVVGYDSVNAYYSPELKQLRIQKLKEAGVDVLIGNVCNATLLKETMTKFSIDRVVHMAAQAGVRNSLKHPLEYVESNVKCFVTLLESMVSQNMTRHPLVYASSSSVYGLNTKGPFHESDADVSNPASLYAATKRADELIATAYYNLHGLNSVGLRFFTVYGPYGRPDMAAYDFVYKILNNETVKVYNHGKSMRDFTYINDVVDGVVASLYISTTTPQVVNLGNGHPERLMDFVETIETSVGQKARYELVGMQQGDVPVTFASMEKAYCLLGYEPKTRLAEGIPKFAKWFLENHGEQYAMRER